MLAHLFTHRGYIWRAAWAEFRYQYAGTQFGVLWHLVHPLLTLAIYVVVFALILADRRWYDTPTAFVLVLCTGLLIWISFTETLLQGSDAFLRNIAYLRRLPFPGEVFVAKSVLMSSIGMALSLLFLVVGSLAFGQRPTWTWALAPVVAILLQMMAFGIALVLAPLRVIFRDVGEFLRAALQLWMWTLPIAYPVALVPGPIRPLLLLNPPFVFIESLRNSLLADTPPDTGQWITMFAWVAVWLIAGRLVLFRCRSAMKDSL
jgi:lipopolysaccharide transport system permease protein